MNYHASEESYGLYIFFPTLVEVLESKESYDWVSYIAELSGWLGLFFGIAVPSILTIFDKLLVIKMKKLKHCLLVIKILAYVIFFCLFLFPAYMSITKFWQSPTSTNVKITSLQAMPILTISLCTTYSIYGRTQLTDKKYSPLKIERPTSQSKSTYW